MFQAERERSKEFLAAAVTEEQKKAAEMMEEEKVMRTIFCLSLFLCIYPLEVQSCCTGLTHQLCVCLGQ